MGFLLPPLLRTWPGRSCRRSSRPCRTRAGTRRGRCSCLLLLLLQAGRRPETTTVPRAGRGGATSRMGGEEKTGGISSYCTGAVGPPLFGSDWGFPVGNRRNKPPRCGFVGPAPDDGGAGPGGKIFFLESSPRKYDKGEKREQPPTRKRERREERRGENSFFRLDFVMDWAIVVARGRQVVVVASFFFT